MRQAPRVKRTAPFASASWVLTSAAVSFGWPAVFWGGWSAWAFRYHCAGDGTLKHVCGRVGWGIRETGWVVGRVVGRLFILFPLPISGVCCSAANTISNRRHSYPAQPPDAPRQLLKTPQVLCFLPTSPGSPTPSSPSSPLFLQVRDRASPKERSPPPPPEASRNGRHRSSKAQARVAAASCR